MPRVVKREGRGSLDRLAKIASRKKYFAAATGIDNKICVTTIRRSSRNANVVRNELPRGLEWKPPAKEYRIDMKCGRCVSFRTGNFKLIAARADVSRMELYLANIGANDNFPLDTCHARLDAAEDRRRSEKFVALHAYNIVRSRGWSENR